MPKPLIVMALKEEGQGRIEALGYEVLYCGVGKVNASYHLTRRLQQAKHRGEDIPYVLNLGSAGSPYFPTGSLVEAHRFAQRDMDATGIGFAMGETPFDTAPLHITFPRRFAHLPEGLCGSGDSFLQSACPMASRIIDMEAYALARICLHENVPFTCVKYITDGSDEHAARDWQTHLQLAADAFTGLLAELR